MGNLSNVFGGSFKPPVEKSAKPVIEQIEDAFANAGLDIPDNINIDGNIHRYSTSGKRGDDAGWYVFFDDKVVCGSLGCWRDNISVNFKQDIGRQLSPVEQMAITRRMSEAKERRQSEQKRKHERAADTVEKIWEQAGNASNEHPYLSRKHVSNHGLRITGDGRLIIPMYNQDGELASLQYIPSEGKKRFHSGGEVKGCFYSIGSKEDTVYIAEGYATAASIHEATGQKVYVAFSANNIKELAPFVRDNHQGPVCVVGDNDESGVGQSAAQEAAYSINARVVIPPELGDANDYAVAGNNLSELLNPPADDFLISADEFSSQPSPIAWLIKRWLQRDALIMVHGPSGGGKTFTVLDMALTIASGGTAWRGLKCTPGSVVYLAGEGHHGLRGRIAAWKHKNKVDGLNMWLSKAGCNLNKPEGYQRVSEALSSLPTKPDLVIVDTLHRFLEGDENSAQDAKTMLDACAAIMERFDCSVLLVHHTGVNDESQHRARGSSAWRGALDIEISVKPGDTMEIIQRKSKDAEIADTLYGELERVAIPGWIDEDGDQVTSAVFVEAQAPAEQKKDNKLTQSIQMIEKCWFNSECDKDDLGRPYVSTSALRESLIKLFAMKESTAKNYTKVSYGKGLVYDLSVAGIIEPYLHGFSICDDTYASSFLMKSGL